jgi:hypothetical protein
VPGPIKLVVITPDDPAGSLFGQPEEDFWPQQPTSLLQAAPLFFNAPWQDEVMIAPSEEDFSLFALLTFAVAPPQFARFPDEEIFVFVPPGQIEEDYWFLSPTQLAQLASQGVPIYHQDEAGFLVGQADEDYWLQQPQQLYIASYAKLPGLPDDHVIIIQPVGGPIQLPWVSPGVARTSRGGGSQ